MAMLRVSSYRKLFEDEPWGRSGGAGMQCAGEYRSMTRAVASHPCECDHLDFVAAKKLSREGVSRFAQDRTVIAGLNNRLANLIDVARCFETENESLEAQIEALEDKLDRQYSVSTAVRMAVPAYSLEAEVERLRREKEEILCDTEALRRELDCLQEEHEKAVQQRTHVQLERENVAMDVDEVTAECLALREQVGIYEAQLAHMEAQHDARVESLYEPGVGGTPAGALTAVEFRSPDITPALDIKEYYCQLAECLQSECGAVSAAVAIGNGQELQVASAAETRADLEKMHDQLRKQIAELESELAELNMCNEELQDEIEGKRATYPEEIEDLECRIQEMRHQQREMQAQMREQCEEYKDLLNEKMARDIEIAAYRGLVEEEEERLCYQ